jgi:DNA-binding CsgD family transcriptional regulator
MVCLCVTAQAQSALAKSGWIDLRGRDWSTVPIATLAGEWRFAPGSAVDLEQNAPAYLQVPGTWDTQAGASAARFGMYTYQLQVLLDAARPADMALYIEEFLTAYTLSLNGLPLPGNGLPGETRERSHPAFAPRYFLLPAGIDTLTIQLTGSNFHHRHSGMVTSPRLGSAAAILAESHHQMVLGGILIGLMLMNAAFQFMLYLHRRRHIVPLLQGLSSLILGLHFLCLNERWLYVWMGEAHWANVYRFELLSLLLGMGLSIAFFWRFLEKVTPQWLQVAIQVVLVCSGLFVLLAPIHIAAEIDRAIPSMVLIIVAYIGLNLLRALRRNVQDAYPLLIATAVYGTGVVLDSFLAGTHVSNLHFIHYLGGLYVLSLSWILSRRTTQAFIKVSLLSEALEKANQELAQQNKWLEQEVEQRTRALVESQAKAHQLELAQKKRDLEALSANTSRKAQLTRNLIDELQKLQSESDPQHGLRSLISNLRGHLPTEDRLEVLQADFEQVNAEFFERLQQQYPSLSKTERELCAYLKLNLSSKDIAALRNTSLNTINVARHRLRKKLGLERDDELEGFVQKV